jgi:hypothetical protein
MDLTRRPHDQILTSTRELRDGLATHPIYAALADGASLQRFMELHVWAVYDFMCLLSRLREAFAPPRFPWVPPARDAARAVNELTLAEESDDGPDGPLSHYELYLLAMREVGADTTAVQRFVAEMRVGTRLDHALDHPSVPPGARDFLSTTIMLCGDVRATAGAFCFGRERLLPSVCSAILDHAEAPPTLTMYLERHVELDGDAHTQAADAIMTRACMSLTDWEFAERAAHVALDARRRLWDAALVACTPNGVVA